MESPNPNPSVAEQWTDLQKKFESQTNQSGYWTQPYPTHPGGGCPACGYCPHCGRGRYVSPYINPWPYTPVPYVQPYANPFWYTNS